MMVRGRVLIAVLALLAPAVRAADPEPRWRVLNREARQATEAKDYAKVRGLLVELQPFFPGSARITYNVAVNEARLGNRTGALAGLRKLAGMGLIYDLAADDVFASLRDSADFRMVQKRMDENRRAV